MCCVTIPGCDKNRDRPHVTAAGTVWLLGCEEAVGRELLLRFAWSYLTLGVFELSEAVGPVS